LLVVVATSWILLDRSLKPLLDEPLQLLWVDVLRLSIYFVGSLDGLANLPLGQVRLCGLLPKKIVPVVLGAGKWCSEGPIILAGSWASGFQQSPSMLAGF
jgi:hypothetical protein